MKKTLLAIAVAMCAQGFALESSAAVLTFESLSSPDDNFSIGRTYTEQGFILDDISTTSAFGFASWGTSNMFFSGSTALINNNDAGLTRLSQVGGGAFSLGNIDLVMLYPGFTDDGADVTFTGITTDNSIVTQSFHVADAGVQNFSFSSNFTNLSSVTWTDGAMYHQFDNINVAAVPEPESYAMFLAGLGLLGFAARRRAAK